MGWTGVLCGREDAGLDAVCGWRKAAGARPFYLWMKRGEEEAALAHREGQGIKGRERGFL